MNIRTLLAFFPLLCATSAVAQTNSDHNFNVAKNLDVFNAIYKNLELTYVDTLDANEVIGTGIKAMLQSLDPYTEYYPEDKAAEYKQMLTGKYAGIGAIISYSFTRKRVVINEPYEYMPAAEAGLRKGDIILSIDGEDMTDKTNQYVSEHLRGEPGSTLALKIHRPSTGKDITYKIQRRTIQLPYLPYYGLQKDSIGYINLNQFVEGCAKDFRRAFIDLKKQGAKSLVLDLRDNTGGSVSEALDILNMFIPKGVRLLSMKGKARRADQEYFTTVEPVDTLMPIVVLVNDMTASSSEITSGALQDLDRAVILGTRTFGKGLVQVPNIPLPYNGKLKVTTAKYYTPCGRCIQAIDYTHKKNGSGEHVADSLTHEFRTANGRIVRDGGGITPDVVVEADSLPNIAYYLERADTTDILLDYETGYIKAHPTIPPASEFELGDADYDDFKRLVAERGFTYDRVSEKCLAELKKFAKFEGYYDDAQAEFEALEKKFQHNIAKDLDYDYNKQCIKKIIASDIVAAYHFQRGTIEYSLRHDKQVKEAMRLLGSQEEYRKLLSPAPSEDAKDIATASAH